MITAYVKSTNYCNVGCSHCYLSEQTRADKARMSMDTVRATGQLLAEMQQQQSRAVVLIWHGGEPLTLPATWYRAAGEVLDETLGAHAEALQTSLIPLTKDHIALIHERFDSAVGTSIDFSARRIKGDPLAYQRLWMEKVDLARSHGVHVVPGMVPTSNEQGRGAELLHWFNERGFREFNVERYNAFHGVLPDVPTNQEHSEFLRDLFDGMMQMLRDGRDAPLVRVIVSALRGVLYAQPGDRWGGECQTRFIVVNPDGSTNNCPDKATHEPGYSSVDDGYSAFANALPRRKWIRLQVAGHRNPDCATCRYNSWCRSGCPIACNDTAGRDSECSGYRSFLDHVRAFCSQSDNLDIALRYLQLVPEQRVYGVVS